MPYGYHIYYAGVALAIYPRDLALSKKGIKAYFTSSKLYQQYTFGFKSTFMQYQSSL
jgi:hypothetical protein